MFLERPCWPLLWCRQDVTGSQTTATPINCSTVCWGNTKHNTTLLITGGYPPHLHPPPPPHRTPPLAFPTPSPPHTYNHHHHHQEQLTSNAESFSMWSLSNNMSDVLRCVLRFAELTGFSMANLSNSNVVWRCLRMVSSKSNRCQGHMTGPTSVLPPTVMGKPCHEWGISRWPVH